MPNPINSAKQIGSRMKNTNVYIVDKKKKSRYQVHFKSFLIVIILFVLVAIEALFNGSYFDEILGLIAIAYIVLFSRQIKRYDFVTLALLIAAIIIGLLSNWYSEVDVTIRSIGIDIVTQVKVIAAFITIKYFLSDEEKKSALNIILPFAKLFCIVAFAAAIISQFADIGMSYEKRYGLNCFNFFFVFNFQYIAAMLLVLASFISTDRLTPKRKNIYYFLSIVAIALNLKSQALIFAFMFIFFFFYFRRHKYINPLVIIFLVVALIFIGQYQINTYLLRDDVARRRFLDYAVVTANNYFPFGSGFATYGSAEAAKNYSPLYYEYGFDKIWGMSPEYGAFLSDTYWASVLGQFGWIGAIFIVAVYVRIFISFTSTQQITYDKRAFMYAVFIQYIVHAIGSGIITSSSGMIGFITLALIAQTKTDNDSAFRIPRIKITT